MEHDVQVKDFYTTGEVAAIFGCTKMNIVYYMKRGRLTFTRNAKGDRLVSESGLFQFRASRNREIGYTDKVSDKDWLKARLLEIALARIDHPSIYQAAEVLGLTPSCLYKLHKKGLVNFVEPRGEGILRITAEEVEKVRLLLLVDNGWYTPKQAAEAIGVSRQSIYNWVEHGRIVPMDSGDKGALFTKEEVERVKTLLLQESNKHNGKRGRKPV